MEPISSFVPRIVFNMFRPRALINGEAKHGWAGVMEILHFYGATLVFHSIQI